MAERFFFEGDNLVYHKQTDPTATLELVRMQRDAALDHGDSWHVGTLDKHVLELWMKEAGIKWSDSDAVTELVRKKLMDSENAAFRVHEGTF